MTTIAIADPPDLPSGSRDVFLPIIGGPPPVVVVNPVTAFYRLLTADQRQQRRSLEVCACLEQAATWRAHGLANGDPWDHVDRHGITANEYARRSGCKLPASYAAKGNNIELLVNGTGSAWAAFEALARGEKHSVALFALNPDGSTNPFFAAQWAVGVAMCKGGEAGWYWCIMMAICE